MCGVCVVCVWYDVVCGVRCAVCGGGDNSTAETRIVAVILAVKAAVTRAVGRGKVGTAAAASRQRWQRIDIEHKARFYY